MKGQLGVWHEKPVSWEGGQRLEQAREKGRALGWLRERSVRVDDDYGPEGTRRVSLLPDLCPALVR